MAPEAHFPIEHYPKVGRFRLNGEAGAIYVQVDVRGGVATGERNGNAF